MQILPGSRVGKQPENVESFKYFGSILTIGGRCTCEINHLKTTYYVMHQQFNIQQLYSLPTLHLCVLYLSENKQ